MDARRTAHLCHAANGFFNFLCSDQHQIGKLVNDDHDLRHFFKFVRALRDLVERLQITHACIRHHAIAPHHFRDRPLQCARCLLRVGHDRDEQVRNAVVNAKLDHLRVDHDELDLLGLCLIEKGDNQRVHADRFAGAGRTGDQHMRQLPDVADDAAAADVLADSKGDARLASSELRRIDHVARQHDRDRAIRHLDADHGDLVGDGRNTHARGAE